MRTLTWDACKEPRASWAASNYALRDALEQAGCLDTTSTAKVGYWLRANKNRNAGGLRLLVVKVNGGKLAAKWQLVNSKSPPKNT